MLTGGILTPMAERRRARRREYQQPHPSEKKTGITRSRSQNPDRYSQEGKEVREKIKGWLREYINTMETHGIELATNGRVDMEKHNFLPPEVIENHIFQVGRKEKKLKKERKEKKLKKDSTAKIIEILTPIILEKCKKSFTDNEENPLDILTIRSAKHDDLFFGIDNFLLLDGDILCSVDVVSATNKPREPISKKKLNTTKSHNMNGTSVLYGYKQAENGLYMPTSHIANFPHICMAIPAKEENIQKFVENMSESVTGIQNKTDINLGWWLVKSAEQSIELAEHANPLEYSIESEIRKAHNMFGKNVSEREIEKELGAAIQKRGERLESLKEIFSKAEKNMREAIEPPRSKTKVPRSRSPKRQTRR